MELNEQIKGLNTEIHDLQVKKDIIENIIERNADVINLKLISDDKIKKYKLRKYIKYLSKELKRIERIFKVDIDLRYRLTQELQSKCTHKYPDGSDAFEYEGRDSHYNYYKCQLCGYETKD